jgi:hypothetical protein
VTSDELKALSEALSSLAKFCLSTAKIDSLHAEAVGEAVKMIDNLHARVLSLEERMAAIERRSQEEISISGRAIRVELPDPELPQGGNKDFDAGPLRPDRRAKP